MGILEVELCLSTRVSDFTPWPYSVPHITSPAVFGDDKAEALGTVEKLISVSFILKFVFAFTLFLIKTLTCYFLCLKKYS